MFIQRNQENREMVITFIKLIEAFQLECYNQILEDAISIPESQDAMHNVFGSSSEGVVLEKLAVTIAKVLD